VTLRILAGILVASSAWAQGSADDLKRCLAEIGGIAWRLPYSPRMNVSTCTSPAASYLRSAASPGLREISLISDGGWNADDKDMRGEEREAAVQSAALAHFEGLFRRHGYERVAILTPYPGTLMGVTYRYSRPGAPSLLWKIESSNSWRVTVEAQP
jgi:hypothetical protein